MPAAGDSAAASGAAAIVYHEQRYPIEPGRDILGLLLDQGADIQYLCMAGSCGTCRVRVCAGGEHLEAMSDAELAMLRDSDGGDRLACQAIALGSGDVVIEQS